MQQVCAGNGWCVQRTKRKIAQLLRLQIAPKLHA
jgi:hypothetical protein